MPDIPDISDISDIPVSNPEKPEKDDQKSRPEHPLEGWLDTPAGTIPRLATTLTPADRWGAVRVRLGIGRDRYTVEPGLYAVGSPNEDSPVLATANYKLTFDRVRASLGGRDLWLLVLDTKGVNVWCAAGKGTFGTEELIARIKAVKLAEVVSHRTVILPQLGAPGVAAHEVRKGSGFRAVYGPVRIEDLGAFLEADLVATPDMRRVRFTAWDRLVLTPVELSQILPWAGLGALLLLLVAGLQSHFEPGKTCLAAAPDLAGLLWAVLAGSVVTPWLLPWIPGRAFAWKGWTVGLIGSLWLLWGQLGLGGGIAPDEWARALLVWPALSAFLAMNFTGCSTTTSPSGVRREMRLAVPLEAASGVLGIILWAVFALVGSVG